MRIIICCVCFLAATVTYAQDNLIFRNGTELSVKVLEVSSSQLKYRRQDNPDGPIYTIGVTDLFLVKYANGTKDVFGTPARPLAAPGLPASAPALSTQPALTRLRYHSGLFSRYFVGETGEPLSRSETRTLLADNQDALASYRRGQSLRRWALATAIPAVALVGVGAGFASFGFHDRMPGGPSGTNNANTPFDDHNRRFGNDRAALGLALAGGGVLFGVAALVLDHKAIRQFRRAATRYNQHSQPVSLQIGPSAKSLGVGMTLTF